MKDRLLEKIRKLCELHPDDNLCRLLLIAAYEGGGNASDLFYLEDEILEKGIDLLL